ncbi:Dolichyl-phosphate beta-D-mannosyltransferase [uncultured delta proteobacterium]|uniref:Dolichyl-phosphate beta-D-mannosyltransferase n=1 Tax=uncultured delta proteobacterium TaxID=34034 RepID=A0A212KAJ7_9DELT|nr:Dolichyl-phosphate beta-D-mannosyltransferase [uncultured delta proteobacterium]
MSTYAVIVPTLNEAGNVSELVRRLENVLAGLDWEVIFVDDDSTDGTLEELQQLAQAKKHVRYLRRIMRKGLASACVEGMLSSSAQYLAVMDADLQHDETKLSAIFQALASGEANVVVASRYTGDGGTGEWDQRRVGLSKLATRLATYFLRVPCSDPMSGFFAIDRKIMEASVARIKSEGFKILFDILSIPGLPIRIQEVPYTFSTRQLGDSKLRYNVMVDFLWLLAAKAFGRIVYTEFVLFCFVGLSGVLVHLATVSALYKLLGFSFLISQSVATYTAMTTNYFLNNTLTFKERKLKGFPFVTGYVKFLLACSLGAFINIAVADYLVSLGLYWLFAALIGTVLSAIFNFFLAKFTIWRNG